MLAPLCFFRGSRPVLVRNPCIITIFQKGVGSGTPPLTLCITILFTFTGSSGNWWMGLTDDFDEMYWVWYESNAPYCYENWMPGKINILMTLNEFLTIFFSLE